jgi:cytoskeletal protein RodZ
MKNIRKQKLLTPKKALVVAGITLVVAAIALGAMAYTKTGLFAVNSQQSSASNASNNTAADAPSDNTDTNNTDENTTPTEKTPVDNQPTDNGSTTPKNTVTASITAANQNGDTLQIRTLIESVDTKGTCSLTLLKGNSKVTRSADIQALASSSTCKGFDIPTSALSPGEWELTITVKLTNKQATLTKTITIT